MPQTITTTVPARLVRVGDRLGLQVVGSKKVGTKWVEFRTPQGIKMGRDLLDAEVEVQREEATPEEEAAAELAYTEKRVQRLLTDMDSHPVAAVKALSDRVDEHRIHGGYRAIGAGDVEQLLESQARHNFLEQLRADYLTLTAKATDGTLPSYLQGESLPLAAFARTIARDLSRREDPLSRSTSPLANLMDDLRGYTAKRMLSDFGDDTVLRLVHVVQAKAGPWAL